MAADATRDPVAKRQLTALDADVPDKETTPVTASTKPGLQTLLTDESVVALIDHWEVQLANPRRPRVG